MASMSSLIKIYHSYEGGKDTFISFLNSAAKTLEHHTFILGLHYVKGEIFYSVHAKPTTYSIFESQFYTHFNDFQIAPDDKGARQFDKSKLVVGELKLVNDRFYPFLMGDDNDSDFIFNFFRSFENFDVINDRVGFFLELKPMINESMLFFWKSKLQYMFFKYRLSMQFYKYMFNHKIQKNRKQIGHQYFTHKLQEELYQTKMYMVVQSQNKSVAESKVRSLFNNFLIFKNYPLNQFDIKVHKDMPMIKSN